MTYRTAEEAKRQNIERMGEPLGSQYSELWQELVQLHMKWQEFVELFATRTTRVELINQAAPGFFRIVQDTLWEGILLHIARLTDSSPSQGRKDRANLTIQNLAPLIGHAETRPPSASSWMPPSRKSVSAGNGEIGASRIAI